MNKKLTGLVALMLTVILLLAACGEKTPPEQPRTDPTGLRTDFEYSAEYLSAPDFDPKISAREAAAYHAAISKAFPDRPVISVVRQTYSGDFYPLEDNDALNVWLEENGYGFAIMVFTLPEYRRENPQTFGTMLRQYLAAGGKCDVIATGPNVSLFLGVPGDTVWDYVNRELIVPLNSIDGADFSAIEKAYGREFILENTDNGNVYGFSISTFQGGKQAAYLAVDNNALSLFEGLSDEEIKNALLHDRDFLSRLSSLSGSSKALGYHMGISACDAIEVLCLNGDYTRMNSLPLYVDRTGTSPKAAALWETEGFWDALENFRDLEAAGLSGYNASFASCGAFIFKSFPDPEYALTRLNLELKSYGRSGEFSVIPLSSPINAVGPECSMFLAAASEQKDAALSLILNALTDEALATCLSCGIEGYSYTLENGLRDDITTHSDVMIYPNNAYIPEISEGLRNYPEYFKTAQQNAEFFPFDNFNADLSGHTDQAQALIDWYVYYVDAIQIFDEISLEVMGYNIDSFLAERSVPDIDELLAAISQQVAEYDAN